MTDGMLLAETQGDRFLEQYDTIILDEAHERSLNVDFLPTFSKLAGVDLPDVQPVRPDGEDLGDVLSGESRPRNKPVYWEWRGGVAGNPDYRPPRLAVRDGRWKLFCNVDGGDVRLYEIPADPEERSNLAAGNPQITARLKAQLLAWKKTLPEGPVQGAPRSRPRAR